MTKGETATYRTDEREWVCEPKGALTVLVVDIPPNINVSPEVRKEWAANNANVREILSAINNKKPLTLAELQHVVGPFIARHRKTNHAVTSEGIKNAKVEIPKA